MTEHFLSYPRTLHKLKTTLSNSLLCTLAWELFLLLKIADSITSHTTLFLWELQCKGLLPSEREKNLTEWMTEDGNRSNLHNHAYQTYLRKQLISNIIFVQWIDHPQSQTFKKSLHLINCAQKAFIRFLQIQSPMAKRDMTYLWLPLLLYATSDFLISVWVG